MQTSPAKTEKKTKPRIRLNKRRVHPAAYGKLHGYDRYCGITLQDIAYRGYSGCISRWHASTSPFFDPGYALYVAEANDSLAATKTQTVRHDDREQKAPHTADDPKGVEIEVVSDRPQSRGFKSSSPKTATVYHCDAEGCDMIFSTITALDEHVRLKHRFACATCGKHLPSSKWLEIHVLETHDVLFRSLAKSQPMYACPSPGCAFKTTTAEGRNMHYSQVHLRRHDDPTLHLLSKFRHPASAKTRHVTDRGNPAGTVSSTQDSMQSNTESKGEVRESVKECRMETEMSSLAVSDPSSAQHPKRERARVLRRRLAREAAQQIIAEAMQEEEENRYVAALRVDTDAPSDRDRVMSEASMTDSNQHVSTMDGPMETQVRNLAHKLARLPNSFSFGGRGRGRGLGGRGQGRGMR